MRRTLTTIVLSMAVALSAQTPPQTPARDTRLEAATTPAPTGTGTLGGIVVAADSSRPLRNATVVVIGALTGVIRVTATDADGRFVVPNLPADRYLVGASKLPFVGAVAGAKRPARPGTAIALANGEKNLNVVVRLSAAAAISGVITDEKGQPATNVIVSAQQWKQQGSDRVLVSPPGVQSTPTDDRGRYRVFGLPPGEYVVSAFRNAPAGSRTLSEAEVDAALRGGTVPVVPMTQATERYASVFFPGTARSPDATPVAVDSGDERLNIDFVVRPVRIARVDGVVTTSDGQPPAQAMVQFTTTVMGTSVRIMPDGRFTAPNLIPGTYTVLAQTVGAQPLQFASTRIEIEGADLSGLELTLRPPLDFAGQLVFNGTSLAPALANRRVPVRNLSGAAGADPTVSPTSATGAFQVTRVLPGKYLIGGPLFFGATNDSVTWSLESVVVDGRDMTDLAVDVTAEQPPKNVVVTYGDRWQQVSGKLRLSSGAAATDYVIVIFPADSAYWLPQSRRVLTTRPSTDGAYAFGGPGPVSLPAGNYLLAAVTDIGRDEQYDPAFLNALKSAAIPVTLAAGERKTQDLAIR